MTEDHRPDQDYPLLAALDLRSLGHRLTRLEQYWQARFRNKFAPVVRFLSRYIPPGGVILDVGAHHGKFARQFARLHGGGCPVLCFEPLAYNYTLLEKVVRSQRNVRVFRFALSDADGDAELFVPVRVSNKHLGTVYAHLGRQTGERFFARLEGRQLYRTTIQTARLDTVMRREGIERLDFMKVDVEGAEALVFRGGLDSLRRFKPSVYCEISPGHPEKHGLTPRDSVAVLQELGYRMFLADEQAGAIHPCTECRLALTDYLFLHPENPQARAVG